jgi:hypothetical protein
MGVPYPPRYTPSQVHEDVNSLCSNYIYEKEELEKECKPIPSESQKSQVQRPKFPAEVANKEKDQEENTILDETLEEKITEKIYKKVETGVLNGLKPLLDFLSQFPMQNLTNTK